MIKIPVHSYLRLTETGEAASKIRAANMRLTDPIGGNIYPSTLRWGYDSEPGGFGDAFENWMRYTGSSEYIFPGSGRQISASPDGKWLGVHLRFFSGASSKMAILRVGYPSLEEQPAALTNLIFGNVGSAPLLKWSPDSSLLMAYGAIPFAAIFMLDSASPNQGHMAAIPLVNDSDQIITGSQVDQSVRTAAVTSFASSIPTATGHVSNYDGLEIFNPVDTGLNMVYQVLLIHTGYVSGPSGTKLEYFTTYTLFDLIVSKQTKRAKLTLTSNFIYTDSGEAGRSARTFDHASGTLISLSTTVKPGAPALPNHTVTRHNFSGISTVRSQKTLSVDGLNPFNTITLFRRQGSSALYLAALETPVMPSPDVGTTVKAKLYKVSTSSINDTDITYLGDLGEWTVFGNDEYDGRSRTDVTYDQRTSTLTVWHPFTAGGRMYTKNADGTTLSATGLRLNFSSDNAFSISPEPGDMTVDMLLESMGSSVSGLSFNSTNGNMVLPIPTADPQPWAWTGATPVGSEYSDRSLSFAKVTTLPTTLAANCMYMLPDATSGLRLVVSDATGRLAKATLREVNVNNEITRMVKGANETRVVATYQDVLNAKIADSSYSRNQLYYVLNASGDPTVGSGAAMYILDWATGGLHKIAEGNANDFVPDWSLVLGRPTSTVTDIDDAVAKRHAHGDLVGLDTISVSGDQVLVSNTAVRAAVRTAVW